MEKIQFAYTSLGQNCGSSTILEAISSLIQLSSNTANNMQVAQHNHNNLISYILEMENQVRAANQSLYYDLENTQKVSTNRILAIEQACSNSNSELTATNNRINEVITENNGNRIRLQEFAERWAAFTSDVTSTIRSEASEQNKIMMSQYMQEWERFSREQEIKSQAMKDRLLQASRRQTGLSIEAVAEKLGI